jgi:predicted aspartyl protease
MKTTAILLLVSLWGMPSPLHAQPKSTQTGKVPTFESLGYQAVKMESNARQSRWLVPVSINGKPCKLVLDTGADFIILASWAPQYFGLSAKPTNIQAQSVGGASKLVIADAPLLIGGTTIAYQRFHARAEGDDPPTPGAESPTCGLLGLNGLRALGVALDIRNQTLWIPQDPKTRAAPVMNALNAATVPLGRTEHSGHMLAFATSGGRPLRLVIDSGAERSVLSLRTAEAMKLKLTNSQIMIGDADDANKHPKEAALPNVRLGQALLSRIPVLVLPLEEVFKSLGAGSRYHVDGILGADVLARRGGVIDLAADLLYLARNESPIGKSKPDLTTVLAGHTEVPLEADDKGHLLLAAKVNGHDFRFVVDSGADTLLFHEPQAGKLGVTLVKGAGTAQGPDGKTIPISSGKVARIDIPGGIGVLDQTFPFLELGKFTQTSVAGTPVEIGGVLGQGFILGSRMILDCGDRRLLVPARGAKPGDLIAALVEEGGKAVPLLSDKRGKLLLPLTLDGEKVALLIDSGASLSTLDPAYAADKSWKREKTPGTLQALGERQLLENVIVPGTTFGAFEMPDFPFALVARAARGQEMEIEGRKIVGILGMNHLVPLRAFIDFGSRQALIPANRLQAKPGSKNP